MHHERSFPNPTFPNDRQLLPAPLQRLDPCTVQQVLRLVARWKGTLPSPRTLNHNDIPPAHFRGADGPPAKMGQEAQSDRFHFG